MRSKEVRDLALSHVEDGTSTKEIAKFLKVSERTETLEESWTYWCCEEAWQSESKMPNTNSGRRCTCLDRGTARNFVRRHNWCCFSEILYFSLTFCYSWDTEKKQHCTQERYPNQPEIRYWTWPGISWWYQTFVLHIIRIFGWDVCYVECGTIVWLCQKRSARNHSTTKQKNGVRHAYPMYWSSRNTPLGVAERIRECWYIFWDCELSTRRHHAYAWQCNSTSCLKVSDWKRNAHNSRAGPWEIYFIEIFHHMLLTLTLWSSPSTW